ncbi:DNA-binding response regulator [Bacillus sp. AFS076308]|uniref:response regulator transcription factor n=1 Tax=unclassified Bacillus (in: firmicutes) TaxID=185979 RepID=UPI000BF92E44|nr:MULTISPECIES: response regulator transcription factor [unclassified Bacillus (in: firmicutes)]PFO01371.1 DNA-binding response regulator [Bacillus sp. AFS076308]PGV52214.1 DNA-binding response regulator [Bacillus sp. AFS037270]
MKQILIIEDEQSIAELERDYLEIEGFQVEIITDGKMGLNAAISKPYSLILLDVMLPTVNGFEICKQIRKQKDIPILMVTAKMEDIDKIRGFGLGADDYIVKPFSPSEMVARVKAHLARYDRLVHKNVTALDEIQVRGLHINKTSRQLFINGKEIGLTAKEFDLLVFFAEHPNQVFSKDHLFERIWGLDSMGDLATVTVHIRKIREKIESDPAAPQFIETIWGAGYRFKG